MRETRLAGLGNVKGTDGERESCREITLLSRALPCVP